MSDPTPDPCVCRIFPVRSLTGTRRNARSRRWRMRLVRVGFDVFWGDADLCENGR